jgi:hypothetical protein
MLSCTWLTAQQQAARRHARPFPDVERSEWSLASDGGVVAWMPVCNADGSDPYPDEPSSRGVPDTYTERTASSFGRSASDFGTAASNVGKSTTSPDIAAPPSGTGYTERSAGNFGQAASTVGKNAGDYGQAAGSFRGQTPRGGTATPANDLAAARLRDVQLRVETTLERMDLAQPSHVSFRPHIQAVPCNHLAEALAAAAGKPEFPDLLLGPLPRDWNAGLNAYYFLLREPPPEALPDGLPPPTQPDPTVEYYLLRGAPHPRSARALAVAFTEPCFGCIEREQDHRPPLPSWKQLTDTAIHAVALAENGSSLGAIADPDAALYDDPLATGLVLPSGRLPMEGELEARQPGGGHIEVVHVAEVGLLAVVSLRFVVGSPDAFAITHPYVVLRRAAVDAEWRVLHLALNLRWDHAAFEETSVLNGMPRSSEERTSGPLGVRLASPPDGDSRAPQPELWWDNLGGAGMQAVEWQRESSKVWKHPHLYFVPDRDPRARTRAVAAFASVPGKYRWRVWSLGDGGRVGLSEWRTFVVVEH